MHPSSSADSSLFFNWFDNKNNFTAAQRMALAEHFKLQVIKKNDYLFKPGGICKDLFFVLEGYFRALYLVKGKQKTIGFYKTNDFITDIPSLTEQTLVKWGVVCHEQALVWSINIHTWKKLCDENPYFNSCYTAVLYRHIENQNRETLLLRGCKTGKSIETLKELYPGILHIIPQVCLASYLNVTPQAMCLVIKKLK